MFGFESLPFHSRRGAGSLSMSTSRLASRKNNADDSSVHEDSMDESLDSNN